MCITHQDGIRQNAASSLEDVSLSTQSAALESCLVHERLTFKGELSQSMLSNGTSDKSARALDTAWKAQLSGKESRFSWGVSAGHMGPAYMTFSNPLGGTPRARYDFNFTINLGSSAFSISALRNRDYLNNDELNPVVETSTGTIRYTYTRPGAPKFLTSYSRSSLKYTPAYASGEADGNNSSTILLGTSFTRPRWSLVPTYILKKAHEISNSNVDDVDTSVVNIMGELRPLERVSLAPQFIFSRTSRSDTGARSSTRQSALSSRLKLIPGTMDFTTTLSQLNTRNDDGSFDTDSVIAGGRADISLDRFISTSMRKSASIQGQVKRTRDHVGETTTKEWEARAVLRIVPRTNHQANVSLTRGPLYR